MEPSQKRKKIFLQPGGLSFSKEPAEITTIVGSCIAVCLWDQRYAWGGMCHYYLPRRVDLRPKSDSTQNNYGEFAIKNLLKLFKDEGSHKGSLVAKVLGGGHVISVDLGHDKDVGDQNIKIALKILSDFGIEVVGQVTAGNSGRKIIFDTGTGRVHYQSIHNSASEREASKLKVLVVDDAAVIRKILVKMIERDPAFKVIGEAADPNEARKLIARDRPDLITLDIQMPVMDGVSFLKEYMPIDPIPTIMITAMNGLETREVMEALEAGAFDYLRKPSFSEIDGLTFDLHALLKSAHGARHKIRAISKNHSGDRSDLPRAGLDRTVCEKSLVLVGSSTGGIEAIRALLTRLPREIPPILIVQHIPPLFSKQLALRLNEICPFEVVEAEHGMIAKAGQVYVAPGGKHMKINGTGGTIRIEITDDPPLNRFKPSVDYLFDSALRLSGKKITAVLMTGMGSDGAEGLLKLKERGAHTIAQDEATSIVYGMPKVAKELGAAREVLPLEEISRGILRSLG